MTEETQQNDVEEALPEPQAGALDLAQSVEIERTTGPAKAKVHHFPALTGWEIRRQYREYLESKDTQFRMAFTVTVLTHASMIGKDGSELQLTGTVTINEQLECWQNVEKVFNAVLGYNGIQTDVAEVERRRWQVAGEDMAASFLTAVQGLIGPALTLAATNKADG